jgi:hypothetical protein
MDVGIDDTTQGNGVLFNDEEKKQLRIVRGELSEPLLNGITSEHRLARKYPP